MSIKNHGGIFGRNPTFNSADIQSVNVDGGTIDGVTINDSAIGGSTAAAGSFTTLSNTGDATLQNLSSTNSPLNISSSASDGSATVDASGNLLVGTDSSAISGDMVGTSAKFKVSGGSGDVQFSETGNEIAFSRNNVNYISAVAGSVAGIRFTASNSFGSFVFNRLNASDGDNLVFQKQTSTVGSISVTGSATAYNTSSDYRLKENVVDLTGSIDRLKQLPVHRFNFIANPDITVDGFLAHEAQAVVPEAVTGEKDGMQIEEYEVTPAVLDDEGNVIIEAVIGEREVPYYQGIDQSKLVPLLTGALQEAIARIETLEAEVAELKGA